MKPHFFLPNFQINEIKPSFIFQCFWKLKQVWGFCQILYATLGSTLEVLFNLNF